MEQIVLNTNLKFLIKQLSFEDKGKLFAALLEENGDDLTGEALGIYRYIFSLQEEKAKRKRKMTELSELAVAARKRVIPDLFDDGQPAVTVGQPSVIGGQPSVTKRKVTKENNLNNKIKKIFISSDNLKTEEMEKKPKVSFSPPSVAEVRAFVEKYALNVHPDEFVDFYTSHGWCVGKTPIKNWQATARLWHRRSGASRTCNDLGCGVEREPLNRTGNDLGASGTCMTSAAAGGEEVPLRAGNDLGGASRTCNDLGCGMEREPLNRTGCSGGASGTCNDLGCGMEREPLNRTGDNGDTGDPLNREGYVYCGGVPEPCLPKETEPPQESPFARFMRRIEHDISSEEK